MTAWWSSRNRTPKDFCCAAKEKAGLWMRICSAEGKGKTGQIFSLGKWEKDHVLKIFPLCDAGVMFTLPVVKHAK